MNYRPEADWEPKEKKESARSIKRAKKKFYDRMNKKASRVFKYILNNHLSDNDKDRLYYSYSDVFLGIEKELSIDKILNRLVSKRMLAEGVSKAIKRKWIISKLFNEKLAN
jgi:hypothetical protein